MSSTPENSAPQQGTPKQTAANAIVPRRPDSYIWGSFSALLIISIIELFSASSQEINGTDIYGPIIRHGMFLAIGIACMVVMQGIHFAKFYKFIPLLVIASILMMAYVMIFGTKINGVKRAIDLGFAMILPAEFLKLSVALGIAWILSRSQIRIDGKHDVSNGGVIACTLLVLVSSGLLFNQGLTNTLLLMSISMGMMLVGGVSWKKLGYVCLFYLLVGSTAIGIKALAVSNTEITQREKDLAELNQVEITEGRSTDRLVTWTARMTRYLDFDKSDDKITDENKQEQYSYIAQARGGLTGEGIGQSRENSRLPLAFSDYIYAIIVEECGAIFAIFIMALYLFLMSRAGRLAMVFKSTLPCLLVIGCALVICLQALFHICIVVGVFPVSGQPLPLISKGGTSIIATCIALGFMLSAARWAARTTDDTNNATHEPNPLPDKIIVDNPSQI